MLNNCRYSVCPASYW